MPNRLEAVFYGIDFEGIASQIKFNEKPENKPSTSVRTQDEGQEKVSHASKPRTREEQAEIDKLTEDALN